MEDTNNNNKEKEISELKKENRLLKLKLFEQNKDEPFEKVLEDTLSSDDVDENGNNFQESSDKDIDDLFSKEDKEIIEEYYSGNKNIDLSKSNVNNVEKIEDIENNSNQDIEQSDDNNDNEEDRQENKKKPMFSTKSLLTIFLIQIILLLILFLSLFFYFYNKQNNIIDKQNENKKELEIIQLKSEAVKNNEKTQVDNNKVNPKENAKTEKVLTPVASPSVSVSPSIAATAKPTVAPTVKASPAVSSKPSPVASPSVKAIQKSVVKAVSPVVNKVTTKKETPKTVVKKPVINTIKKIIKKVTPQPIRLVIPTKQTNIIHRVIKPQVFVHPKTKTPVIVKQKVATKTFIAKETPISNPPLGLTIKKVNNQNYVVLDKIKFDNEDAAKKAKEAFQKNLAKEKVSNVNLELHNENGQYSIRYKVWTDKKSNSYIKKVGSNLERVWTKTNPSASPETPKK